MVMAVKGVQLSFFHKYRAYYVRKKNRMKKQRWDFISSKVYGLDFSGTEPVLSNGDSSGKEEGSELLRKGQRALQPRQTLACGLYPRLDNAFVYNQQVFFFLLG